MIDHAMWSMHSLDNMDYGQKSSLALGIFFQKLCVTLEGKMREITF